MVDFFPFWLAYVLKVWFIYGHVTIANWWLFFSVAAFVAWGAKLFRVRCIVLF